LVGEGTDVDNDYLNFSEMRILRGKCETIVSLHLVGTLGSRRKKGRKSKMASKGLEGKFSSLFAARGKGTLDQFIEAGASPQKTGGNLSTRD